MRFTVEEKVAMMLLYVTEYEADKTRDKSLLLDMDKFLFDNENMQKHLESLRQKGVLNETRLDYSSIALARALTLLREYPDIMSDKYFIFQLKEMIQELIKRCTADWFINQYKKDIENIFQILENNFSNE